MDILGYDHWKATLESNILFFSSFRRKWASLAIGVAASDLPCYSSFMTPTSIFPHSNSSSLLLLAKAGDRGLVETGGQKWVVIRQAFCHNKWRPRTDIHNVSG